MTATYKHKVKCMHCSLHFTVYSWNEDWKPVVCPECTVHFGNSGGYCHWREIGAAPIYTHVPGSSTKIVSLTQPTI